MNISVLNSLSYTVGWFWSVLLGVNSHFILASTGAIFLIIEKATKETLQDLDKENTLKLLYDRQCPICAKEICILRKKDKEAKINFVDISSKAFSPSDHNNIDYNKAMSQIHAIDHQGNILIGVPAFAALYARCNLLITSTLLRISFVKFALTPLYTLFAKNRLWITGRADTKSKK